MPRTRSSPGVQAYFETLRRVFAMQAEVLTGVLPHNAERGRNDDERFRDFLRRLLPSRFSVGSGFLVCSDASQGPSSQTDVVIYDHFLNSPLHAEQAASVFPIEMVYGTIEVKGRLQRKDLQKILQDIVRVRELAQYRIDLQYGSKPKKKGEPTKRIVSQHESPREGPAPRAFVFAYEQTGWTDINSFKASLTSALTKTPAHIHGIAVLKSNWFLSQEAYASAGVRLTARRRNALLEFTRALIHGIASMPMGQASISRYLRGRK